MNKRNQEAQVWPNLRLVSERLVLKVKLDRNPVENWFEALETHYNFYINRTV